MAGLRTPCRRAHAEKVLGKEAVRRLLATGELRQVWPGVLLGSHELLDPVARAGAALLRAGPDALLTTLTTARLHGCPAADTLAVHVHLPYSRWNRSRPGLVVHHGRRPSAATAFVHDLPSVPLEEATAELLCTAPPRQAIAVADQAAALVRGPDRAEFVAQVAGFITDRPDRRGTRRATALVKLVSGRAQSPPESWLKLLLAALGYPPPTEQFAILDVHGRVRFVLDLCWPELRIALEYDGFDAHDGRGDADAARDEYLRRRGWITIRVRVEDLTDPGRVLGELADAFGQRGGPIPEPLEVLAWPTHPPTRPTRARGRQTRAHQR